MSLQVCLLRTGESIVADVREVIDKEKNEFLGYKVFDPFVIDLTDVGTVSVVDSEVLPNNHTSTRIVFRQWAPLSESMEFQFAKDFIEVIYPPCRDVENSYIAILADYKSKRTITARIDPEKTVVSGQGGLPLEELENSTDLESATPELVNSEDN